MPVILKANKAKSVIYTIVEGTVEKKVTVHKEPVLHVETVRPFNPDEGSWQQYTATAEATAIAQGFTIQLV